MRYRVCRPFVFCHDGFTPSQMKVGDLMPLLPRSQEEGLLRDGLVECVWPEPEAKAEPPAPENKAIMGAPENKARGRGRK